MSAEELKFIIRKIRLIAKENKKNKALNDLCEVVEEMAELMTGVTLRQEKQASLFRRVDDIINIDLKKYL